MYIKMLDGRYAGEVRDIENGTALTLIASGRAAKAFASTEVAASVVGFEASAQVKPAVEITLAPSAAVTPQNGRRRRGQR